LDSANLAAVFRQKSVILTPKMTTPLMPHLLKRLFLFTSPLVLVFLGVEIYLRSIDTSYTEKNRFILRS